MRRWRGIRDLKASERRAAWAAIADGRAKVVVGARSALFLPFADLRVTIVDEAHETSFKQEEGVHYHARDVAVMRAREEAATVVLATATPAIETQVQAAKGTYRHLVLPARFGGAQMPDIAAVDLRRYPPTRGPLAQPAAGRGRHRDAGKGRTGAAVPQPPRLCAADAVPGLRRAHPMPQLHRLDGRASPVEAAGLPPLRPPDAGAAGVPGVR